MRSSPMKKIDSARMLQQFLSSPPSLTNDEDVNIYNELYTSVKELTQPKDVWDQMMVNDVTNHFWEQMRLRRSAAFIIKANRRRALEELLVEGLKLKPATALRLADAYFGYGCGDRDIGELLDIGLSGPQAPKTRDEVVDLLAKYDLDESCIDQLALKASIDDLKRLDDLAFRHEFRREQILREIERRRDQRSTSARDVLPAAEVRALPKTQRKTAATRPRNPDGIGEADRREPPQREEKHRSRNGRG
jgi:hypothetical protein